MTCITQLLVFFVAPNQRTNERIVMHIPFNEKILRLIEKADQDLAELVHAEPCPHCGGKLHWANYPRSPRGIEGKAIRFSLCCSHDGCRRRQTPESIRFLGRKVYPGLIVVLVSAMNHGLTQRRVTHLRETLAVSRATLNRWRRWWRTQFVQTPFWKAARAHFMPSICESSLPKSLCEGFSADQWPGLMRLLMFLGPITTVSRGSKLGFMMVV